MPVQIQSVSGIRKSRYVHPLLINEYSRQDSGSGIASGPGVGVGSGIAWASRSMVF